MFVLIEGLFVIDFVWSTVGDNVDDFWLLNILDVCLPMISNVFYVTILNENKFLDRNQRNPIHLTSEMHAVDLHD